MNLRNTIFPIVLLFSLFSCGDKSTINYTCLSSNVWIYDSDGLADSIKNFTDNYVIFDGSDVVLNGNSIGDYTIYSDTLRIFQTMYTHLSNGTYQKKESNQFLGIIRKADTNEIWIEKIAGCFPIKYQNSKGNFDDSDLIKLTNQKNRKHLNRKFTYVGIATSHCYGECPVMQIELDNRRNINYTCTANCKKIGNFKGVISARDQKRIEELISYLNLHNDSTIFVTSIDTPESIVLINVNNKAYYFKGSHNEFQFKMQQLLMELHGIVDRTKLERTTEKIKFRAALEFPKEDKIIFLQPTDE